MDMDSILTSVKKQLGPSALETYFDPDIIMFINSMFLPLRQMGIGPAEGFFIEDVSTTWDEFIPDDVVLCNAVKGYMYAKVKLAFDPPSNASHIKCLEQIISEFEWRGTNDPELS